jgi:hypothetical protein
VGDYKNVGEEANINFRISVILKKTLLAGCSKTLRYKAHISDE